MTAIAESIEFMLRPAAPDDEPFIFELIRHQRMNDAQFLRCTPDQQQVIVRFERDVQLQALAAVFPAATTSIITAGGENAGQLVVDRSADAIRLVDIELLPQFCGCRIGTRIVRALCEEAAAHDVPLTLRVAVENSGARRLYERLGFDSLELDGAHIEMIWCGH